MKNNFSPENEWLLDSRLKNEPIENDERMLKMPNWLKPIFRS